MQTPKGKYYVYELCIDGYVFYIGKGSGPRIYAHAEEARSDCECLKCLTIRDAWQKNSDFTGTIVYETTNESDAFKKERELIAEIGRDNLLNRSNGGEGPSQSPLKVMYRQLKQELRDEYLNARRCRDFRERDRLMHKLEQRKELLEDWYMTNADSIKYAREYFAIKGERFDLSLERRIKRPW